MNKYILLLVVMGLCLISFISAETIYAGECLSVDLSELESLDNVVYNVVGNSSNLEGLTIELNGTMANICTVSNYKPDSFTIIFIDDSTKEVIKEVTVGSTKTITEIEQVDNYIAEYIDKIINDDEEIQRLNEELQKTKDELDERKKEVLLLFIIVTVFSVTIIILINKYLRSIKLKGGLKKWKEILIKNI